MNRLRIVIVVSSLVVPGLAQLPVGGTAPSPGGGGGVSAPTGGVSSTAPGVVPPELPRAPGLTSNDKPGDGSRGDRSGDARSGPVKGTAPRGGSVMPRPGQRPPPRPAPRPDGRPGAGARGAGRGKVRGKGHGAGSGRVAGARGTAVSKKRMEAHLDWEVWWVLNHERFVDRTRHARRLTPRTPGRDRELGDAEDTTDVVLAEREKVTTDAMPALRAALRNPDPLVRQGAAVAVGRLARPDMDDVVEALRPLLGDPDARVRTAACLGLGLTGNADAVDLLLHVMEDGQKGRELTAHSVVQTRTRCFAALSLGLLAARDPSAASGAAASRLVQNAIVSDDSTDLQLACIAALQFFTDGTARSALRMVLTNHVQRGVARAQAALSLAKIGATEAVTDLRTSLRDEDANVVRSSAIALGVLAGPEDAATIDALIELAGTHADRSARNFALVALGEIGGVRARNLLLSRARKGVLLDRTWSLLGLGIMGSKGETDVDGVADFVVSRYRTARSVSEKGLCALVLALLKHDASRKLLAREFGYRRTPELRGNLAIALGLLGERSTAPELRNMLRRPREDGLTRNVSIALGLLQDGSALDPLRELLTRKRASGRVVASAARALGDLGDARGVPLLLKLLDNTEGRGIARAYAAAALGLIGDKDAPDLLFARLRWHTNSLGLVGVLYEFAHLF